MDFPILTDFDKRTLICLLDAEAAGVDLTGRNGERVALDHLVAAGLDQARLFEVQVKLGLVVHKARIQLGLQGHAAIPWSDAMALTLENAATLKSAGALAENAPPPSAAESTRKILTERDVAAGGSKTYA